jgi:DhnA family fructose-bisphosphate aldolase class Ia
MGSAALLLRLQVFDVPSMSFGKQVRWNRLFHTPSGRLITLAIDHGTAYRFDMPEPLFRLEETYSRFHRELPDAIVAQRGSFGRLLEPFAGKVPLMLQAVSVTPDSPDDSYLIADVDDAIDLGADALAVTFAVGGARQKSGLMMVGELVRRARRVGLPVVSHVYPFGQEFCGNPFSERSVAYAARAAFEVGVDVVKVHYTGDADSFRRIVEATPIPVIAAGGPRLESPLAVLRMARDVVSTGARGLTIGRNLWGDRRPAAILKALKAVCHEGLSADEAYRCYAESPD